MKQVRMRHQYRGNQAGYALLLVLFLAALLLISTMVAAPRILTEGKREKEQEMIWRGKQYVRGVKLYYRKMGRFPTSLDDLTKPKVGNLRFMRQAYKDPMNKADGSWRLIYVGPAGQLIGSLKQQQTNIKMPAAGGQPGASGSSAATSNPLTPGATAGQASAGSQPGASPTGTGSGAQGTDTSASGANPQPVPTGDAPTIIGGSIIGVGSKINQPSLIIWDKAENYRLFEFIWDPSKDVSIAVQQGTQIGAPAGPGQNPSGTQPNPGNPSPNQIPPRP